MIKLKTRLNVLKSEAEQICLWGEAIYNEGNYLMICTDGQMVFDTYGGSDDTKLSYENEYKDYEWRLTDINNLNQGDVCKMPTNSSDICVFDKLLPITNKRPERLSEFKGCYLFWFIHTNRPLTISNYNILEVYKLFKNSDKK